MQATLDLIKREGFEGVTIRKIGAATDSNISLVNYYFGSKEKLINESIKILLTDFQETFTVLDDVTISPKERLKLFLMHYVKVIHQYPEVVRKTIALGTTVFSSQYEYGTFMKTMGFNKIQATLKEITHEENPDILMMMTVQLLGAIFLPALMSPIFESGADIKMASIEEQINLLFQRYFHEN
nr:TetR/AcrR family transcriptional regulator [Pelosinus baikalensis]